MVCDEKEQQAVADSFEAFDREVLNIRMRWELWRLMTGSAIKGPDAKILFDAAPRFHWYASQGLLAAVVLGLSRLADSMKDSQGRENLTLERVHQETEDSYRIKSNVRAKPVMKTALELIRSDDFRKVRNKVLAHNDLATIIGKDGSLDVEVIRRAVDGVACFHSRIKAVREGTGMNHKTGEGAFASPADVQVCWQEITRLIARLT